MITEKRLPNQCLPEFFEIIQAYGAYIRERNLVRESNKNFDVSESLSSELSGCRIDQYSYSYRENGADFGITKSEIGRIESTINHIINEEKASRTKNLIATEKNYKRLKHLFKENHTDLIEIFDITMKEHINYVENKKRKEYQKHNELLVLSPRFISFFQYVFNCGEGDKMAFNQFANVILKRTNGLGFYDKDYQILFHKLNADENIQIQKLDSNEIKNIANALKIFLNAIQQSDIENFEQYIENYTKANLENKKMIYESVILKNINRFKKLLLAYENIVNS